MRIQFHKYHGCGNDFIVIDGRDNGEILRNLTEQTLAGLCHRRFGIGADGLMVLEDASGFDFSMLYWNADGRPGSMCGNGARCIVEFAYRLGIVGLENRYHFMAPDGPHEAYREVDGKVCLRMSDVGGFESIGGDYVLDTGSPHYVRFCPNVSELDIEREGKLIRHSERFDLKGINVNFVERIDESNLFVRTFERGVEAETMSCGTGVTASAIVAFKGKEGHHSYNIRTPGGNLKVEFRKMGNGHYSDVWLIGPATLVFTGEVETDR